MSIKTWFGFPDKKAKEETKRYLEKQSAISEFLISDVVLPMLELLPESRNKQMAIKHIGSNPNPVKADQVHDFFIAASMPKEATLTANAIYCAFNINSDLKNLELYGANELSYSFIDHSVKSARLVIKSSESILGFSPRRYLIQTGANPLYVDQKVEFMEPVVWDVMSANKKISWSRAKALVSV